MTMAALVAAFGFSACSTTDPATGKPRESSIPWNRPSSWEGPGVYGSALSPR
jgi:hypothetical protein